MRRGECQQLAAGGRAVVVVAVAAGPVDPAALAAAAVPDTESRIQGDGG